jgi:CRISPR-associated protein Csd1
MILQSLYQLAESENLMGDPDFESKPVAWLVYVNPEGRLAGKIVGTHYELPQEGKKKPRVVVKPLEVPLQPGRSGKKAPAYFLVDNAKYVFGKPIGKATFSEEDGAEKAATFRTEVQKCYEYTKDEGVGAVLKFLEWVADHREEVPLPEEAQSNDLFAFIYSPDEDILIHQREAVRDYWRKLREPIVPKEGSETRCLVSGEFMSEPGLFPLIKRVPNGTPSGVGLVSFNRNAFFSYGWSGNENAPISREASETCATALNRLLHPAYPKPGDPDDQLPRRNLSIGSDTAVCYWTRPTGEEDVANQIGPLLEANPEKVGEAYRSIWFGKPPTLKDGAPFYALVLSGSQGRAIIREWFETTIDKALSCLAQYFEDLDIVLNTPKPKDRDLPPAFPLALLAESLATLGKRENVPSHLTACLVRSAFSEARLPISILQRAVERSRAEFGRDDWSDLRRKDARAALIKAVLNRNNRKNSQFKEVKPMLDPTNSNNGYLLGQLMAVIERLQRMALGDVNATVVDRFFSGASATPRAVFLRLTKNARHHVRKAKDDPRQRGAVFLLERLFDEVLDHFPVEAGGIPAHLDLQSQGLFILGYHQMRKWLWMPTEDRRNWESQFPDAARAYKWSSEKSAVAEIQEQD